MTRSAPQSPTESPCVRNCCLDDRDICMGCGRSLEEIIQWQSVSLDERAAILERAARRRAEKRQ